MFDLGFRRGTTPRRADREAGRTIVAEAVVDPLSHYSTDAEMVAVTVYNQSPMTGNVSMTFYPDPAAASGAASSESRSRRSSSSSRDSYTRTVHLSACAKSRKQLRTTVLTATR
jgi:hypothetical protein